MKTLLTLFSLGMSLLLACGASAQQKVPAPAAGAHRYLPPSDPNLDPNWDWTVAPPNLPNLNGHPIYFNPDGTSLRSGHVQVPFFSSGHQLADALTTSLKDMYREDGWMLVYRDFGTPQGGPKLPFFILYNKYRGILRVMVYNGTGFEYSAYRMSLAFRGSSPRAGLFTFTAETKSVLTDYDGAQTEVFLGRSTPLQDWFYGDFVLFGYDPTLRADATFQIRLQGVDKSTLKLNSTAFTLDEVLNNANPGGSNGASNTLNTGVKFFGNVNSIRKAAQEKNSKGDLIFPQLATLASSTGASIVPFIGPVLDIITLFIGGKTKAAPREPMNFKGVLNFDGSMQLTRDIWVEDFAFSPANTALPEVYRPVQPIPWGVFNLNKLMKIRGTGFELDHVNFTTLETFGLVEPLTYTFNPNAGMTLVSVRVGTGWGFTPIAIFNQSAYFYRFTDNNTGNSNDNLPRDLYLELTLRINDPVRNSDQEIIVYKKYPLGGFGSRSAMAASPTKPTATPKTALFDVAIAPNPTTDQATIRVSNAQAGTVSLRLLDVRGQELWHTARNVSPGPQRFTWDGHQLNGKKVDPGVYLLEVVTPAGRETKRIQVQ